MKPIYWIRGFLALLLLVLAMPSYPPPVTAAASQPLPASVFINEFHYDNAGTDTGEAIEVAAPAGMDLSGWTVVLYNGADTQRSPYSTDPLGPVDGACGAFDLYVIEYPANGIQNGDPDGIALVDASGNVVQFLSYEGAFATASGPAAGLTSTPIGPSEGRSTPAGHSLQLRGTGASYGSFAWNGPAASTFGDCNQGQMLDGKGAPGATNTPVESKGGVDAGTSNIVINEVDADTMGTDAAEFVELYDGGLGGTVLDGLVVVFYNGNGDGSYAAYNLDGHATDAGGYFVLGNSAVTPVPDLVFANNSLQNGADAVALYRGQATDFPSGTPLTTEGLLDALVYGTGDPDDTELLILLHAGQPQVDENGGGDPIHQSNQRCADGSGGQRNTSTYIQAPSTPGTANCVERSCATVPQIQGAGPSSPCLGHRDSIEGCITGVTATGFYFQDEAGDGDPDTSDGIFAYFWSDWDNPEPALKAGDRVRVSGQVVEYYGATEFAHRVKDPLVVTVIGDCSELPAPVAISPLSSPDADPSALYEQYEGMRVQMSFGGMVIGPTNRFASRFAAGEPEIALVDRSSSIYGRRVFQSDYAGYQGINYLSGGFDSDLPDVDFGDQITVTNLVGVLGYQFDKYTLMLDGTLSQTLTVSDDVDSEDVEAPLGASEFAICSFNLENLFDLVDDADGDYWDGDEIGDWVPASGAEYQRIVDLRAKAIATNLANCPIIGVQEVEGKDGVWDALVEAVVMNGGVAYQYDYYESYDPRDITVGLLYDPLRVTLDGSTQAQACQARDYQVSAGTLVNDNPDRIIAAPCSAGNGRYPLFGRPPYVAQLSIESNNGTKAVSLSIVVNHFKSKRDDESANLPRREAQALYTVDLMRAEYRAGRTNVVALGDFNDVLGSTPLLRFETSIGGEPLVNLFTAHVPEADRYTYIFGGQSQVLDHFIMTFDMNNTCIGGGPVHINADYPDVGPLDSDNCIGACSFTAGAPQVEDPSGHRSSDHDPVFVRFGFSQAVGERTTPTSIPQVHLWTLAHPARVWYNCISRALNPLGGLPIEL